MVDTLKEFINQSGITYTQLKAGVTVLTNSSTEQAVIKDVSYQNTSNRVAKISVGGTSVLTLNGISSKYAGTEIVGESTSAVLSTDQFPLFTRSFFINSSSSITECSVAVKFDNDLLSGNDVTFTPITTVATTSFSPVLSVSPKFACFDASGNFYYADNTSTNTNLYKRAGGVNGTQTTLGTIGFTVCYDDSRYIYGYNSTTIFTCDTTTGTITSASLSNAATTPNQAYATISAVDGIVVIQVTNSVALQVVNPATGVCSSTFGNAPSLTGRAFLCIIKNSNGEYRVAQATAGTTLTLWKLIGATSSTPSVSSTGTFSTNNNSYGQNIIAWHRAYGNKQFIILTSSNTVQILDVDALKISTNNASVSSYAGSEARFFTTVAADAETSFGTTTLRATGVKTTA